MFQKFFTQRFQNIFTLDTKSLAVFRIFFGIVLLLRLGEQYIHIDRMFGPQAIMKPSLVFQYYYWDNTRGFHTLFDNIYYFYGLFAVHFFLIFAFILGWKTPYTTFFLWIWTLSLQMGNPLFRDGFDMILCSLFLWLLFLPLGSTYSLDAKQESGSMILENKKILSWASIAIILWIFVMYAMIAFHRRDVFWQDTSRLRGVLHMNSFVTPVGVMLRDNLFLMKAGGIISLLIEGFSWLIFIFPYKNLMMRRGAILMIIGFHIFIGMTLQIWLFALGMIAIWTLFYPLSHTGHDPIKFSPIGLSKTFILILLIGYTGAMNSNAFIINDSQKFMPASVFKYANMLGLNMHRNMFAGKYVMDTWYTIEGKGETGSINIFNKNPYHQEYDRYYNENQRRLFDNAGVLNWLPPLILDYYCKHVSQDIHTLIFRKHTQSYSQQSGYETIQFLEIARKDCR